jgi:crotonobetainyl-CoA:carnitine CoA-transferase CaiB-like acyl-CoA transferase
MEIASIDTESRATAIDKINTLREQGASYKEQLDVIAGVRPAFGNIYYRCYQTADGFVAVGSLSTPLRKKLLGAVEMEDWRVGKRPEDIDYTNPEVVQYCKDLVKEAERRFKAKTTHEWLPILDRWGVPAGNVQFTEELLEDPQVLDNGYITEMEHPMLGPIRMAGPMIQMSETPLEPQGSSPTLGEHTDEVLRSLGYDDARIAALREAGALGRAQLAE